MSKTPARRASGHSPISTVAGNVTPRIGALRHRCPSQEAGRRKERQLLCPIHHCACRVQAYESQPQQVSHLPRHRDAAAALRGNTCRPISSSRMPRTAISVSVRVRRGRSTIKTTSRRTACAPLPTIVQTCAIWSDPVTRRGPQPSRPRYSPFEDCGAGLGARGAVILANIRKTFTNGDIAGTNRPGLCHHE